MATPYLGQLMLCPWNFAAKGWSFCNGQLLPLAQYQALFALLGTTYGGDGIRTFGLPNLQCRTPLGQGNGYSIGQSGGEPTHTLAPLEVPAHTHVLNATSSTANALSPAGALFGAGGAAVYGPAASPAAMNSQVIGSTGGGQPHENRQPFLVMNWCIALNGIFPTRS